MDKQIKEHSVWSAHCWPDIIKKGEESSTGALVRERPSGLISWNCFNC